MTKDEWPKFEKRKVSFNNGDVPARTITIILTPTTDEDKAIRNWITANGMGLIRSWKVLKQEVSDVTP